MIYMGFPDGSGKEPACQCRRHQFDESLLQEYSLEEEIATNSIILAWKIPWTEVPGRLLSMGPQRAGHNWATKHTQWYIVDNCSLFDYSQSIPLSSDKGIPIPLKENISPSQSICHGWDYKWSLSILLQKSDRENKQTNKQKPCQLEPSWQ